MTSSVSRSTSFRNFASGMVACPKRHAWIRVSGAPRRVASSSMPSRFSATSNARVTNGLTGSRFIQRNLSKVAALRCRETTVVVPLHPGTPRLVPWYVKSNIAKKKENPPLAKLATPLSGGHKSDGSARALLGAKGGADRGDQLLGIDRLVDAIDEARGHQALALDLREGGEGDRRGIALVAAGELDRARAAQRLEAVLARHREVDEQHVRPARRQRRFERDAERAPGIEAFDLRAGLSQRERHDFVGVEVVVDHPDLEALQRARGGAAPVFGRLAGERRHRGSRGAPQAG